jgi:hypothetical protein
VLSHNSTMPSSMCVKPEKSFELTRPEGAVELRANAAEGRKTGMLWVERVGNRRSWGIPARNFFLEVRVR